MVASVGALYAAFWCSLTHYYYQYIGYLAHKTKDLQPGKPVEFFSMESLLKWRASDEDNDDASMNFLSVFVARVWGL
jgi:hypothetical protein